MKGNQKLTWKQLESEYQPSDFSFKTTDELESLEEVIGQERAKKAIEFGLSVQTQGYNIYMSGEPGTGKTTFAKIYAQKVAEQKTAQSDWCYVYNFKERRVPKALSFEPGDGRKFRNDMNELIAYLTKEIPYIYTAQEHEDQKRKVLKKCQKMKELSIEELEKHAKVLGFLLRILEDGISFIPLDEQGEPITQQKYDKIEEKEQRVMENGSTLLKEMTERTINDIKDIEQEGIQEIEDLEYHLGLKNIGYYIKILKERYSSYKDVQNYLEDLQQDILENIDVFIAKQEKKETISLLPWSMENDLKKLVSKYDVNLLVDNGESIGAPVIVGDNSAYNKLLGELEYDNECGTLSTDYMKIKPGLFHKANGGYLILQAEEVLANHEAWGAIKKVLKTKELCIENPKGISVTTVASLKPEPIPIVVKVILIGSTNLYGLLYQNDLDFKRLFRVRADFDSEMTNNQENVKLITCFIKTFCNEEFLLPFSVGAVKAVLRYAVRYVENQKKITSQFNLIGDILIEASTFAGMQKYKVVEQKHVQQAIEEKRYRASRYEERIEEKMMDNTIMIETDGSQVGQINALTISDIGEYRFGNPMRITATTYKGQAGIISIEKEARLSGDIHTKGTQVIAGYLGQTYAQEFALSITCRICFEQNYGKIDGDSASSAELYSIISSLSGIPIKQNIAVTGSVNQHGMVQPVGGVTHKIEGFFRICKKRGLTGDQGVIMPKQNIQDLVLDNELIEAIKNNLFHIYPISNIKDGLEILMGKPYKEIHEKVEAKLNGFSISPK